MIMNAHAAQRRATKEFRGEKAENPSFGRPWAHGTGLSPFAGPAFAEVICTPRALNEAVTNCN